jgi:hypothetical protein
VVAPVGALLLRLQVVVHASPSSSSLLYVGAVDANDAHPKLMDTKMRPRWLPQFPSDLLAATARGLHSSLVPPRPLPSSKKPSRWMWPLIHACWKGQRGGCFAGSGPTSSPLNTLANYPIWANGLCAARMAPE